MTYVTLNWVKMLAGYASCFLLRSGLGETGTEFSLPRDVLSVTDATYRPKGWRNFFRKQRCEYQEQISSSSLRRWIAEHQLNAVFFNEFGQWYKSAPHLAGEVRDAGCTAFGYLVLERFDADLARQYDVLLAPSRSYREIVAREGIHHTHPVPYSLDFREFPKPGPHQTREQDGSFVFFHPAGRGGYHERKNTRAVLEAFSKISDPRARLVITTQKQDLLANLEIPAQVTILDKDLARSDLIAQFYSAHYTVLPSRWETIGIPILESMAAGTPVITLDGPPMNEFVTHEETGLLVQPSELRHLDEIYVPSLEVNPNALADSMRRSMDTKLWTSMAKTSRAAAEELYDLEKNKYLLRELVDSP